MASRGQQRPQQEPEELAITKDPQELQTSAAGTRAQAEIQAAFAIAKRFPRNEQTAYEKLLRSADRHSFAEDCAYSFPRGGTNVTGPSVVMAREAARIWGNIRYGLIVLRDDEDTRLIRGWAIDLESNTYTEADDDFSKLIQRKQGRGETIWVKPDERDLRELTNRRGAILVRNCILQLIPKDFIEDAIERADRTLEGKAKNDPDAWKKIVSAFGEINVRVEQLVAYLGHSVAECSPAELTQMRQIYKSISDGNSTWQEYAGSPVSPEGQSNAVGAKTANGTASLKDKMKEAQEKLDHRRKEAQKVDQDPEPEAEEMPAKKQELASPTDLFPQRTRGRFE